MIPNASKTLTTAMMPSSRLVVPSSADMSLSSEWRRLACAWIARLRRLTAVAHRLVQELPPFVRDAGGLVDGRSKVVELAGEVVERRLELSAQPPPAIRKKQIPGQAPNHRADNRRRHRSRVLHHDASSWQKPPYIAAFLQVMCHEVRRGCLGSQEVAALQPGNSVGFQDAASAFRLDEVTGIAEIMSRRDSGPTTAAFARPCRHRGYRASSSCC